MLCLRLNWLVGIVALLCAVSKEPPIENQVDVLGEAFALTIALGLRFLGVLLMGALIIVPAASGRRLANSLSSMLWSTVTISVTSTLIGTWIGLDLHRQTGPLIVLVAAGIFLLSLSPLKTRRSQNGRPATVTD
jgi:hypothetical protein